MKKQSLLAYFQKPLVSFFAGALLLSVLSLMQKKMFGVPFSTNPVTFLTPILLGGFTGLAISVSYIRLRASRERLRNFLNNVDDLVQIISPDGGFLFVNKVWRTTMGYSSHEVQHLTIYDIIHPAHLELCTTFYRHVLDEKRIDEKFETVFLTKNGTPVYVKGKVNCRIEDGQVISTESIVRNITKQHEADKFQRLAASVFEKTSEGIVITDKKMTISFINAAFTNITGYGEEALGNNIQQFLPPINDTLKNSTEIEINLAKEGSWQGELLSRRKSGEKYSLQVSINAISNQDDEVLHYAHIISDITMRKENEASLYHLATHDKLTDLPNREMFYKFAAASLQKAKEKESIFAVLFLDLDNFKEINDQYGHQAGDTLLRILAQRLHNQTRENDIVARFGGDEFIILINNIKNRTEAKSAAENILKVITKPFHLDRNTISTTASIGISLYTKNSLIDSILNDADQAMYQAKQEGKNRIAFITKVNQQSAPVDVEP